MKTVLSNFDFLAENWNFLLEDAKRVEAFALRDPRTSSFYSRRTLERALQWLYRNDSALKARDDSRADFSEQHQEGLAPRHKVHPSLRQHGCS